MTHSFYVAQQARWMRSNAVLWVRPDAARFLKPGTRVEDVFPALVLKYSPTSRACRRAIPMAAGGQAEAADVRG